MSVERLEPALTPKADRQGMCLINPVDQLYRQGPQLKKPCPTARARAGEAQTRGIDTSAFSGAGKGLKKFISHGSYHILWGLVVPVAVRHRLQLNYYRQL